MRRARAHSSSLPLPSSSFHVLGSFPASYPPPILHPVQNLYPLQLKKLLSTHLHTQHPERKAQNTHDSASLSQSISSSPSFLPSSLPPSIQHSPYTSPPSPASWRTSCTDWDACIREIGTRSRGRSSSGRRSGLPSLNLKRKKERQLLLRMREVFGETMDGEVLGNGGSC